MSNDVHFHKKLFLVAVLDPAVVLAVLKQQDLPVLSRCQLQVLKDFHSFDLLDDARVTRRVDKVVSAFEVPMLRLHNQFGEARINDLAVQSVNLVYKNHEVL